MNFSNYFHALTGHEPFPWQINLYEEYFSQGKIPESCNIPTGLGKTSVVAIWLIALAESAKVPRRLVYVVNRRTVVDQTTNEIERLRDRLANLSEYGEHQTNLETLANKLKDKCALKTLKNDSPLAISTLRGQFADNREWSADPARPAVICGTVDMIGSRLLFSGYGIGFKSKPLHAGFLGQDALLVHDEAHLEPAFQQLVEAIVREQHERERTGDLPWPKLRVMALTATSRGDRQNGNVELSKPCGLTKEELTVPDNIDDIPNQSTEPIHHVWWRLKAKKRLAFHTVDAKKGAVAKKIGEIAAANKHKDGNYTVLIYVRTLEDVSIVEQELKKTKRPITLLTGTMRGKERDELVNNEHFKRFLKGSEPGATVYLICTSAGEVGIDISADHMVCDLTPFDSMAQRFGRVNRFGKGEATIDIVHPETFDEKNKIDIARKKTLELLKTLGGDASPLALMNKIDANKKVDAFTPEPTILCATDILFDAWALTTIRGKMPGRPEVAPYLHGIADELSQTTIAWRAELDLLTDDKHPQKKLQAIFSKHPIRPHETVTTNSNRVLDFFKTITKKQPALRDIHVAIVLTRQLFIITIGALINNPGPLFSDPVCVLPASFGGLNSKGMLSTNQISPEPGSYDNAPFSSLDIADMDGYEPITEAPTRLRILIERSEEDWKVLPLPGGKLLPELSTLRAKKSTTLFNDLTKQTNLRIRLVQPITFDDEGNPVKSLVSLSPVRRQQEKQEQLLNEHVKAVEDIALKIADNLKLPEPVRTALLFSAKWHDEGKKAPIWQRYIGGIDPNQPLGKSSQWHDPKKLGNYRHEFGTLLRIEHSNKHSRFILTDDQDLKDLVLHMIAAHHGNARPHFPIESAYEPDYTDSKATQVASKTICRFARLQRKYGRWGLAYLESLLRAADIAVSAYIESEDDIEDLNGGEA